MPVDYDQYIDSDEWKKKRNKRLDFAGHRCEVCYRENELAVHHRTYERLGDERLKDIIVLCRKCHEIFHNRLALHSPEEVPEEAEKPRETLAGETSNDEDFPSSESVPTGFSRVDSLIGGLLPSTLNVVAGRPRMGVSDFVQDIALSVSEDAAVSYFSTRSGATQVSQKLLASLTGLAERKIISGNLSDEERTRVASASDDLENRGIQIYDAPDVTLGELREESSSVNRHHDVSLIVVDCIEDVLYPSLDDRWREKQYPHLLRKLRAISHTTDAPILVTTTLDRSVLKRDGNSPRVQDLPTSEFESQADVTFLLNRPEEYGITINDAGYSMKGMAEVHIHSERVEEKFLYELEYSTLSGSFDSLTVEKARERLG